MKITSCTIRSLHRVVVRLVLLLSLVASARAQILTFQVSSGSTSLFYDTVGYAFTVKQDPLSVHRLGVNDIGGDGLDSMNIIGLWREGGSLLATAILPSGRSAPLESGFRWFDLTTPVLLDANTTYRLGVQANLDMRASGFVNDPISPNVNLVGAVRNNQQGNFTYPGTVPFSGQAIVGPNMGYTVVPEPSTLALVVAAGIAIVIHRRINLRRRLARALGLRP
ncbi:MAG: PEP-CTERM sorting domain-containing protein [Chthoniobacterales bacterium]|nr:PEP-CTERM sorting domain-containing protein [Chthoniobacterales bacterium]